MRSCNEIGVVRPGQVRGAAHRSGVGVAPAARQVLAAWDAGRAAPRRPHKPTPSARRRIAQERRPRAAPTDRDAAPPVAPGLEHPHPPTQFPDPSAGLLPTPDQHTTTDSGLPVDADPRSRGPRHAGPAERATPRRPPRGPPLGVAGPCPVRRDWTSRSSCSGQHRPATLLLAQREAPRCTPDPQCAVVHGAEEVVEARATGVGAAFISAGNADLHRSPVFVTRPVPGLSPANLGVVWRRDQPRPAVDDYVNACCAAAPDLPPSTAQDGQGVSSSRQPDNAERAAVDSKANTSRRADGGGDRSGLLPRRTVQHRCAVGVQQRGSSSREVDAGPQRRGVLVEPDEQVRGL